MLHLWGVIWMEKWKLIDLYLDSGHRCVRGQRLKVHAIFLHFEILTSSFYLVFTRRLATKNLWTVLHRCHNLKFWKIVCNPHRPYNNDGACSKSCSSSSLCMLIIDVWNRGSAENVELDIFAKSNQDDLSNQEILIRLYFLAIGICNAFGLSSQPKLPETSAPDAKYELPPNMACFEFHVLWMSCLPRLLCMECLEWFRE